MSDPNANLYHRFGYLQNKFVPKRLHPRLTATFFPFIHLAESDPVSPWPFIRTEGDVVKFAIAKTFNLPSISEVTFVNPAETDLPDDAPTWEHCQLASQRLEMMCRGCEVQFNYFPRELNDWISDLIGCLGESIGESFPSLTFKNACRKIVIMVLKYTLIGAWQGKTALVEIIEPFARVLPSVIPIVGTREHWAVFGHS